MSRSDVLRRSRLAIVLAFGIHGALSGTLGPRIPALKDQSGVSAGALGVSLTGFAVGLFVGTRLAGRPLRRLGSRQVIRIGIPIMGIGLTGLGLARDPVTLTAAFVVLGAISGLLDVAINAHAVAVEREYKRPIMSSIHGTWSAGMLAGSAVGSAAAGLQAEPLLHFGLVSLALGIGSRWALEGLLPRSPGASNHPEPTESGPSSFDGIRSASVLLLGLIAFSSFTAEGAAADWSAVYLRDGLGADAGVAGTGFVAFSAGMTASRFLADGLSSRFGPVFVVRTAGLVAAGALGVGLLAGTQPVTIAAFAVMGAALGPVVPITLSAAGNTSIGSASVSGSDTALGWVVTIGYLGTIVGPVLIGFTAEWVGLRLALLIPVGLALAISAAGGRAKTAAALSG